MRTRAIPERFCGGDSLRGGAISSACTLTLTLTLWRRFAAILDDLTTRATEVKQHQANLAVLSLDSGVERHRQNQEKAKNPDDCADDDRFAIGSIADGAERMDDGQISVEAHQRHREDARVQVDAPERVEQAAADVAEHPAVSVRAVGHQRQTDQKQIVGHGQVQDEARRHRP